MILVKVNMLVSQCDSFLRARKQWFQIVDQFCSVAKEIIRWLIMSLVSILMSPPSLLSFFFFMRTISPQFGPQTAEMMEMGNGWCFDRK